MSRVIMLTQGQQTVVDDEDYEWLSKWSWYVSKDDHTCYAIRAEYQNGEQHTIPMHRVILDAPVGINVDHEDLNGLNNQRSNLRLGLI